MNKSEKKTSLRQYLWLLPLMGLMFLGIVAGLYTYRYQQRFLPGTAIAGVDCSSMTVREAADTLKKTASETKVILGESSGEQVAELPLDAFLDDGQLEAAAQAAFANQKENAGLFDWILPVKRPYPTAFFEKVTPEQAAKALKETLYGDQPMEAPVSAKVVLTEEGYEVIPEIPGNKVDMAACAGALAEGLRGLKTIWPAPAAIISERGFIRPAVTADSEEITAITADLDSYLQLPVSLDFGGEAYVMSAEEIRSVCDFAIRWKKADCTPDPERVRAFLDDLVDRNGYDGVYAKFRHVAETRPYAYFRVGDNGWILDRADLTEQLCAAIREKSTSPVVPNYDYTWYWKGVYSRSKLTDTYIEISLDNQYLWAYKDGKLIVETPVVTGNVAQRSDTRRGFFRVSYKVTDVVLKGPTWNDHVDYWMPFDGDIGLHDSSWRSEYGGDIYLNDGSHGCVNTPLAAMRKIYRNFKSNDIVIVY